jgi:hypothetical protein
VSLSSLLVHNWEFQSSKLEVSLKTILSGTEKLGFILVLL